ncbi:hypothetical protein OAC06_03495 [Alphaproteobacteria bacterium]|nr:hypothetical protein [Alphaproteobacteria bacterium]
MNKKYIFLILQVILITFFKIITVYSIEEKSVFCKGIYWSRNNAEYAEWHIIKGMPKYYINFKINDLIKKAKFSIRKGNGGTIIGTGGWDKKTGEKSSLTISYSLTNKTFKMKSRYSDTRIEGKCRGNIKL